MYPSVSFFFFIKHLTLVRDPPQIYMCCQYYIEFYIQKLILLLMYDHIMGEWAVIRLQNFYNCLRSNLQSLLRLHFFFFVEEFITQLGYD